MCSPWHRGSTTVLAAQVTKCIGQPTRAADKNRQTILLQGEELEPARIKAEKAGVKQIFIDDLREDFVGNYVFPMFRCSGLRD